MKNILKLLLLSIPSIFLITNVYSQYEERNLHVTFRAVAISPSSLEKKFNVKYNSYDQSEATTTEQCASSPIFIDKSGILKAGSSADLCMHWKFMWHVTNDRTSWALFTDDQGRTCEFSIQTQQYGLEAKAVTLRVGIEYRTYPCNLLHKPSFITDHEDWKEIAVYVD